MGDVSVLGQAVLVALVVISLGQLAKARTDRRARRRVLMMPPVSSTDHGRPAEQVRLQPAEWRPRARPVEVEVDDEVIEAPVRVPGVALERYTGPWTWASAPTVASPQ